MFIVLALAWGVTVDEFGPNRYDLLGALICAPICAAGVMVMAAPPRGG